MRASSNEELERETVERFAPRKCFKRISKNFKNEIDSKNTMCKMRIPVETESHPSQTAKTFFNNL